MVFDRNDEEYGNLQKYVIGTNAYNRVYMSLNNYYNTMNYERRQDKKIRQDFDFQVSKYNFLLLTNKKRSFFPPGSGRYFAQSQIRDWDFRVETEIWEFTYIKC